MIKLDRTKKPAFLTDIKVTELTNEFKKNGTAVWNVDEIKNPLLLSSNGKCAYCECSLTSDSNYMEVEHFEDKKNNPDKVVEWENLLPSCKKCNGSKSTHDVIKEPIINPFIDEPKIHLAMRAYRIKSKTTVGKTTIDVTDLNHSERHVNSRFNIGEKINALVDSACERFEKYSQNNDTRTRNRLTSTVEGLLKECQPEANYAASTATLLLTDKEFIELINAMKAKKIWNAELEESFDKAQKLILDLV